MATWHTLNDTDRSVDDAQSVIAHSVQTINPADIMRLVVAHFADSGKYMPDMRDALLFAYSEVAEASDILLTNTGDWVRNNPDKHMRGFDGVWQRELAEECGDAIMMLMIAGLNAGYNPIEALINKITGEALDQYLARGSHE